MRLFIFLFFSTLAFYACRVEDDSALPNCETIPDSCICPRNYAPVCGCDQITYSNACEAECDNIFDYTPGVCP